LFDILPAEYVLVSNRRNVKEFNRMLGLFQGIDNLTEESQTTFIRKTHIHAQKQIYEAPECAFGVFSFEEQYSLERTPGIRQSIRQVDDEARIQYSIQRIKC
jgi:hypothetical protein